MCPQPDTGIEDGVERWMQPGDGACDRRGECQTLRPQPALREQLADASDGHAAHVRVARVVDREVVPQHATAGTHPSPHRIGQPLLKRVVEQRRKHGGLKHDVLACSRHRGASRTGGVAAGDAQRRRAAPSRPLGARRQQFDALQISGRKPNRSNSSRLPPLPQPTSNSRSLVKSSQPRLTPAGPRDCALTLLHGEQRGGIQQAVAMLIRRSTRVPCHDGGRFIGLWSGADHRIRFSDSWHQAGEMLDRLPAAMMTSASASSGGSGNRWLPRAVVMITTIVRNSHLNIVQTAWPA